MCIIVAKPSGVKMPDEHTLENCFTANPHGAGFMLASKNRVYGFKGLMTFEEFMDELDYAEKRFGKLDKLSVVMHFRIRTHGEAIPGNTHPFPLYGDYRQLRLTEWEAKQGFAHNGIIPLTASDDDIKRCNVSDTMVFAKKFIIPIAKHVDIASDKKILDMLYELADSKLCFLSRTGKIATRGEFINRNGVLYSNRSFEDYVPLAKVKSQLPFATYDIGYSYKEKDPWKGSFMDYLEASDAWHASIEYDDDDVMLISDEEYREKADELAFKVFGALPLADGTKIILDDDETIDTSQDNLYFWYIDVHENLIVFDKETNDLFPYADWYEYDKIIEPDRKEVK